MQRRASVSRFSFESADYSIAPAPPKPFGKLGKLLRLKTDPSTSNGKYHTTGFSSDNTPSLTFESPLSYSTSFHSRPKIMIPNDRGLMSNVSHYRNLNHSASAPAIRVSVLRPSRTSSMKDYRSSPSSDPLNPTSLSGSNDEPRLFPVRRQPESPLGAPQVISEKKSKWRWKERMTFIPRHSRSPSPVTQQDEIQELPAATLSIVDISGPPCLPITDETRVADSRQLPGPSSPEINDLCLTPTSTRSSSLSESEQPTRHTSQRSRGSINKVSRTLGFPEITFATEFGEVPLSASYDSYNPFDSLDLYPVRKQPSVKLSRRLSLTLSNLTAIPTFFRPSSTTQPTSPPSPSRTSLSTLDANDVHQFGLADDLSDSWGKIPESLTNSSDLQISPITFHTPTHVLPPSSSGDMKLNIPGEVSPPFPTLTSGRSQSHSSLRRVAGTAPRPHTPFDERTNPPAQAIRLGPHLTPYMDPMPQVASKTANGEWNQDDLQDVIKKLRYLK